MVLDNTLTGNEAKVNFDTTLNTEHTYKLENNTYGSLELTLNVIEKTNEEEGAVIHLSSEYYNKYLVYQELRLR